MIHSITALSLFEAVQMQGIFADSKTFCDCISLSSFDESERLYQEQKNDPHFQLAHFVQQHFRIPEIQNLVITSNRELPAKTHITQLWQHLTRMPHHENSSLLPLPNPYIVPGGRFQEIYYWDSYFTMLGLKASEEWTMIESMVDNFAYLIHTYGFIPNGNRTYFLSRSQPPFFSYMIELLAEKKGKQVLLKYLSALQKEYDFWMQGTENLTHANKAFKHVVLMDDDGTILNRYWDAFDTPRPEAYKEDAELASLASQDAATLYRHIRSAAASGWDFSVRWQKAANDFSTIHTTDIIPVDLNCLLYHTEMLLAESYALANDEKQSKLFNNAALQRKSAILKYCWNEDAAFFTDYDWYEHKPKNVLTLAAAFPFFVSIATTQQAACFSEILASSFCKEGGLIATLVYSGQQWDFPNGWAPLHWVTIVGLENYNHNALATKIAKRWLQLNNKVFARTGKMMEKYNVVNTQLDAGGGEYPGQDGFGWTNGVLLALEEKYG